MERTLLILTTLPHYCALVYADSFIYRSIIIISTTLSIIWHSLGHIMLGETLDMITYLDYKFALIWALYEIKRGSEYKIHSFIIILNIAIFVWNIQLKTWFEHCIWHLFSVLKSVFVAYCIQRVSQS